MFLFGDFARTTQLFHSSAIDELMAEPPVARRARQARETAPATAHATSPVARLVSSSDLNQPMPEAPAVAAVARPAKLSPGRERTAA